MKFLRQQWHCKSKTCSQIILRGRGLHFPQDRLFFFKCCQFKQKTCCYITKHVFTFQVYLWTFVWLAAGSDGPAASMGSTREVAAMVARPGDSLQNRQCDKQWYSGTRWAVPAMLVRWRFSPCLPCFCLPRSEMCKFSSHNVKTCSEMYKLWQTLNSLWQKCCNHLCSDLIASLAA